ncbi:hypothetical protein [Rhizobium sp. LCM 4573]|uniref:hypothetical protein n=1 Tax=Rhizobium sp. LCM 4573 TaxID=1848291 RepID=UPI0018E30DC8|nr:hypothetical protein [Rhizobium sp. LCM 4573]
MATTFRQNMSTKSESIDRLPRWQEFCSTTEDDGKRSLVKVDRHSWINVLQSPMLNQSRRSRKYSFKFAVHGVLVGHRAAKSDVALSGFNRTSFQCLTDKSRRTGLDRLSG